MVTVVVVVAVVAIAAVSVAAVLLFLLPLLFLLLLLILCLVLVALSRLKPTHQEGGDLKKKREMFAKQREEMKQAGKLDDLREKLPDCTDGTNFADLVKVMAAISS